jgi:hypothetical protein
MTTTNPGDLVLRFQSAAPVDVVGLARALGINVWKSASTTLLPVGASGLIRRDDKHGGQAGYSIIVRSTDAPVRRRFTIAHEIAHFLLHRDKIGDQLSDDAMYRSSLSSDDERAANRLAADILMPMGLIQDYMRKHGTDEPSTLAAAFRVSEVAMRIRLGLS